MGCLLDYYLTDLIEKSDLMDSDLIISKRQLLSAIVRSKC